MALNSLFCADVPLSNYSLTHSLSFCLIIDYFAGNQHQLTPIAMIPGPTASVRPCGWGVSLYRATLA